jgi:hypothetical protein
VVGPRPIGGQQVGHALRTELQEETSGEPEGSV